MGRVLLCTTTTPIHGNLLQLPMCYLLLDPTCSLQITEEVIVETGVIYVLFPKYGTTSCHYSIYAFTRAIPAHHTTCVTPSHIATTIPGSNDSGKNATQPSNESTDNEHYVTKSGRISKPASKLWSMAQLFGTHTKSTTVIMLRRCSVDLQVLSKVGIQDTLVFLICLMCWDYRLFLKGDIWRLDLFVFTYFFNGLAQVPFECVLIEAYKGTRRKHNIKFRHYQVLLIF